jgi:hypothetical protein
VIENSLLSCVFKDELPVAALLKVTKSPAIAP